MLCLWCPASRASSLHTSTHCLYAEGIALQVKVPEQPRKGKTSTGGTGTTALMNILFSKTKVRLPSTHESGRCIAQAAAQAASVAR